MLEFMSNEVFQIIVIIAFVFIGIEIYYFCRHSFKIPSVPEKSDISTDKIYEIVDDIDYRLDRINTKVNELMNMFMNGLIVNDDQDVNDEKNMEDEKDEKDENTTIDQESNMQFNAPEDVTVQQDYKDDNIIFDDSESLNNAEEKPNIEQRIIDSIKNHINELNYDGLEISDLPKTEDLQSDDGNGTSLELSMGADVYEQSNLEPIKKLKIAKRLLS